MLQALRYMISAAGDKMSEPIRKAIHQTLIGMLSHPEDVSRCAAAGCLGALCRWFTPEQLNVVLSDHLLCKCYLNSVKFLKNYLKLCVKTEKVRLEFICTAAWIS